MRIRLRGERRARTAHLARSWQLNVAGADPFRPEEPDTRDVLIVSATREEREALRKAGFGLADERPLRRAA